MAREGDGCRLGEGACRRRLSWWDLTWLAVCPGCCTRLTIPRLPILRLPILRLAVSRWRLPVGGLTVLRWGLLIRGLLPSRGRGLLLGFLAAGRCDGCKRNE